MADPSFHKVNNLPGTPIVDALYFRKIATRGGELLGSLRITDQSGNYLAPNDGTYLYPEMFGVTGDGTTDDSAALDLFFTAVGSTTGVKGYVPRGTYLCGSKVVVTHANNLHVECDPEAIFKGDSLSTPVLEFTDTDTRTNDFVWKGGVIDQTTGTHTPGSQSSTGIDLIAQKHVSFEGTAFLGASTDYTDDTGDSAITPTGCDSLSVRDCFFFGWADGAIYSTGGGLGASSDDGFGGEITGCVFKYNAQAITVKRDIKNLKITGNTFIGNNYDITLLEITGTGSAHGLVISHNTSVHAITRFFEARASVGGVICDNVVRDWGYDRALTTATGTPRAIYLRGCSGYAIHHNIIGMDTLALHAALIGVLIENYTDVDSVAHSSEYNHIDHNRFKDLTYGVRESGTVGTNFATMNLHDNVTNKVTLTNTGSIATLLETNGNIRYFSTGGEYATIDKDGVKAKELQTSNTGKGITHIYDFTATGISVGAVADGATTATTLTSTHHADIANVVAGDQVIFERPTGAPGLSLDFDVDAGAAQLVLRTRNGSGASVTPGTLSIHFTVLRIS